MNLSMLALAIAVPAVMLGACLSEPTTPAELEDTAGPGCLVAPPLDPDDGVATCNCACGAKLQVQNPNNLLCFSQPAQNTRCSDTTFTVTPAGTTCDKMEGQSCTGYYINFDGSWSKGDGLLKNCGYGQATAALQAQVATD